MRRRVTKREVAELRARVLDIATCVFGKVIRTLDEAKAELDRAARYRTPLSLAGRREKPPTVLTRRFQGRTADSDA